MLGAGGHEQPAAITEYAQAPCVVCQGMLWPGEGSLISGSLCMCYQRKQGFDSGSEDGEQVC